jgi:hypothetical protein
VALVAAPEADNTVVLVDVAAAVVAAVAGHPKWHKSEVVVVERSTQQLEGVQQRA